MRTPLPADLLQDVSRRLGIIALAFAGACLWRLAGVPLLGRIGWLPLAGTPAGTVVVCTGFAVGLGIWSLTRRPQQDRAALVTLAVGFQLLGGFLIVLVENLDLAGSPAPGLRPGLSWVAVWIAVFPLVVPAPIPVTLGAAFVTASLSPLAWVVAGLLGYGRPAAATLPVILVPNYVAAALAGISAMGVRRMHRTIVEARAMGSYHLVEQLGSGGMGEVWLGKHRLLARPAAVKLIRPDVLAETGPSAARVWIERFRREAEAAATLRSPHTIELYDFGEADDGTFYYVMEMLEGIDLQAMVERFGPVTPCRAIHLLSQACASLGEAHARGLIHRDIKPSNIFACRLGLATDFVKVLDFGLVRASSQPELPDTSLTIPGFMIGTPAYMAPELAGGDQATHLSDVYSLGCVAYWLHTGRMVFDAANPSRALRQHLFDEPEPPSRHSPHRVPPELDALVLSCLAKEPEERPAALELGQRLEGCEGLAGWTPSHADAWWREHLS
jgi:serine/threonine-protein kinase